MTTEFRRLPGVLLAGGLARRMGGGDKPMRQIGGRTILERVIARLKPQCDGLILNANGDPARFAGFGLPVDPRWRRRIFRDRSPAFWPASTGPRPTGPTIAWVLSAAADCPFLPRDLVARLHRARSARERAARGRRLRRPVASGDRIVERRLARGTAPRAGRRRHPQDRPLDRALSARHRDWPVDALDPFFNANTVDDIADGRAAGGAGRRLIDRELEGSAIMTRHARL